MVYQVFARKYRPQTFDEVIGQAPIVRTLKNAIERGLVTHGYLFSGTRGVGKTTTARILAKALNCEKGPTTAPCGQCPPCREIALSTCMDVLEVDAASTGRVEEIRELIENARYLPARDRYKIFIIDEAHMLSREACNALLKTLEEPPPRVVFILATTEPQKILPTIHSRCQSFHFRNVSFQEILQVLARVAKEEKVEVEPEGLGVMARVAEGSLRDALSLLDQAVVYCGTTISADAVRELLGVVRDEVLEQMMDAIHQQSSEQMLELVDQLVQQGQNPQHFCREALRHIRNLMVVRIGGAAAGLAEAAGAGREKLEAAAQHFTEEDLLRFFNTLMRTEQELRWSPQPRLHLELGLLKLVQAERLVPLEEALTALAGGAQGPTDTAGSQGVSRSSTPPAAATPSLTPRPVTPVKPAPAARPTPVPEPPQPASGSELDADTMTRIHDAVYEQSKFLGSFVDHVVRWTRESGTLTLWFTSESRGLLDMLDRKQQANIERIISEVLGEPVKVQARVAVEAAAPARLAAPASAQKDNAVVQALLDRFGGTVRPASELPPARRGSRRED